MPQTVKLNNDELLEAAKTKKDHFSRSLNGQIEYWARLGRFVEESGLFDLHKVNLAFQGTMPVEDLTPEEQHAHARLLWQILERWTVQMTGFCARSSGPGQPRMGWITKATSRK